jgi:hypothetical protein
MKSQNLNLIWNELNYFEEKIAGNTVHSSCLYSARPIQIGEGPAQFGLSAWDWEQGSSLPYRHRRLAGKIRSAGAREPWGQRPRSKPQRRRLHWGLDGVERLTKGTGSGEALGRWVHAVERQEELSKGLARASRKLPASVRSSGGDGNCGGGPGWWFVVAQWWQYGGTVAANGAEEEKGRSRGGGRPI